jgi:cytoskeletal protein CcmA (bactofilin family)
LARSLSIGEDLFVKKNVTLNILGGQTINNGNFTVAKESSTFLTGLLDVDKTANIDGATTLQSTLDVKNGSATHLTGLLDVDQTLNVDGAAELQSTLDVKNGAATHLSGDLDVDGSLNVDGAFVLNNTMSVAGDANFFGSVTVNDVKPTHLTGLLDVDTTLNVDGATDLNSTLSVDGATDLNSSLNVDGTTNLNAALNVNNGAATHMTGALDVDTTLNVDGVANMQSALNVNNAAATHLTGTLTVDQATTLNGALNANGQMTISANVPGGDGSYGAYPLRVQGSEQGIAIKLTAGTPDNSNNFITFFNSSGGAVGRIEGETTSEATSDPEFIFTNSILVAEEVKAGVNVGTSFIPVTVGGIGVSAGPCGACIAAAAADLVLASANLAAYNVFTLENLGVTYQSGSADYAEWLERSNSAERITAGDIVGVNGGKISKYTNGAQQFLVISTKPAILGNMPSAGQEKLYEKVAFMGQIPVKVRGVVISGDYILPSGLNDGTGIAVSRDEIKPAQYRQIVGVAWSNAVIQGGISTVNMAIGLNANDVADLAVKQEQKLSELENKFNTLESRMLALEKGEKTAPSPSTAAPVVPAVQKSQTRYDLLASNMPSELSDEVMDEAMKYLENSYRDHGIDVKKHPGLDRLFADAGFRANMIRKAQATYKESYKAILKAAKSKN